MSPCPPVSRASRPLLSPSCYGATGVPCPAGCVALQLPLHGHPVLPVLQRHFSPHLSSPLRKAPIPQLPGEVGSASMCPHWMPRCLSAGPPFTALPVHTPVNLATAHINCYPLPANPTPAILPRTQQVLNKCLWSERVEVPRLQGFKPKPSEWRVHGHRGEGLSTAGRP